MHNGEFLFNLHQLIFSLFISHYFLLAIRKIDIVIHCQVKSILIKVRIKHFNKEKTEKENGANPVKDHGRSSSSWYIKNNFIFNSTGFRMSFSIASAYTLFTCV